MAEVGKAYVQILPSAKGIKGSISKQLNGEADAAGSSAGLKIGGSLVKTLTGVVAAAGIGKAISASITEGAALQQSIGGIETLFKDNADQVIQYANDAYKTAGMSANDYMETVTGFSASLLQSLGGDTKAAGDAANQAVIDMSDNANKMGTDMQSIQNAYQGFAKQNYTMLDNLKLGYGGTKEEMQRLLDDAEKLSGQEYDISSLDDVYSAIHVIQDELGITGTTAKEASETFTGSFSAMRASAKNLLGALSLGDDVTDEVQALGETVSTFVFKNLLPMIGNIIKAIPSVIKAAVPMIAEGVADFAKKIRDGVPQALASAREFVGGLISGFAEKFPEIISKAGELIGAFIMGVIEKVPELLTTGAQTISTFLSGLSERMPELIDTGGDAVSNFIVGLIEKIPSLISAIGEQLPVIVAAVGDIIIAVANFLAQNFPLFVQKGIEIIQNLAQGIVDNWPAISQAIGDMLIKLLQAIINYLPKLLQAGIQLITSLVRGMLQIRGAVVSSAGNLAQAALSRLLSFVGQMLSAGARWISSVVSGLLNGAGRLASAAASVARNALSSFLNTNWASVGSNIISGIVGGLWGAAGSLFSSLRNLASNALSAAKNALDIGSPSKVFRDEVGKWIPEGIAEGIASVDTPTVEIEKTVNGMVSATSAQLSRATLGAPQVASFPAVAGEWTINVYAAPGMDENMLADKVARRINQQIRTKGAVYA